MEKINKEKARKFFNAGKTIRLCASKINPINVWGFYADVNNGDWKTFDQLVNEFAYYNCSPETGKRVCYYTTGDEK